MSDKACSHDGGSHQCRETKMTQHTLGPWVIQHNETWGVVLVADGGRHVAKVFNSGNRDQVDSDARLIAAAPELLVTLTELTRAVRAFGVPDEGTEGRDVADALHEARALLAKIERT
mgnify:CR=1 FL=1